MELRELVERTDPSKTLLLLGAGASIPSGCPSGTDLALQLERDLDGGNHHSDDLTEVASILELRHGRRALVDSIAKTLGASEPVGGLAALPDFGWPAIYTTNFDVLIERSYVQRGHRCVTVRSNFDWDRLQTDSGTPLYKIHGCVTSDRAWGHRASMILTDQDYETFRNFREILYHRLAVDLASKPVLILGHALKDPHLRAVAAEASRIQREVGGPGKLFALVYTNDPDRIRLLESRGFNVAVGGIDEFVAALATRGAERPTPAVPIVGDVYMSTEVMAMSIDVRAAKSGRSNLKKVFYGAPGTYADIHMGGTFARKIEDALRRHLKEDRLIVSIIGAAGVGKTTLARRLCYQLESEGWLVLEQQPEAPLRVDPYLKLFADLATPNRQVALFIDDASNRQRDVNRLVNGLVRLNISNARLVLTAELHQWNGRQKAAPLFSHGHVEHLTRLEPEDIRDLLRLAHEADATYQLMDRRFRRKTSVEQEELLRGKCGADMFVCLKNIFATDSLDAIILREYASLPGDLQEIYRYVAALHAAGVAPHRQMILRLLGVPADGVAEVLRQMEDIVEERSIVEAEGLYEWLTRHEVVAETLAGYKFAAQDELYGLLMDVIVNANPTLYVERRTLSGLCNWDFGIRRIEDLGRRIELYEAILRIAPGERVARHRLVGEYLAVDQFDAADSVLNASLKLVGIDAPMARYQVRVLIQRAERLPGILEGDRRALLIRAKQEALSAIRRFPDNRFVYEVLGDVALAWKSRTGSNDYLDEALPIIQQGIDRILDPELVRRHQALGRARGMPSDNAS